MKRQLNLDKAAFSNSQVATSFPVLQKFDEEIMEQDVNDPIASEVSGIVITNEDYYTPQSVELRSRISSRIITVDFSLGDLEAIQSDPKVVSVSLAERIPLQKYNQE